MPKRKVYTDDYKIDAIFAAEATTFKEAAEERGINSSMLARWAKEAKAKILEEPIKLPATIPIPDQLPGLAEPWHPDPDNQPEDSSSTAENLSLKHHIFRLETDIGIVELENTRLEEENEILRKALALYVK